MVSNVFVENSMSVVNIKNEYSQYINDDNIIYFFSFSVATYKFLKLQYYLRAVQDP